MSSLDDWTEEEYQEKRRACIARMPSWRPVCGRDWLTRDFRIGFYWCKNNDASEGEQIYTRHRLIWLRFHFNVWIDRC